MFKKKNFWDAEVSFGGSMHWGLYHDLPDQVKDSAEFEKRCDSYFKRLGVTDEQRAETKLTDLFDAFFCFYK